MPPAAPVTAALAAAGGGGKRAGGRAEEGRLLPPCQDRRFLSSLGPLHARTRAPPLAAPRPQGSESFAFHLRETKRGKCDGAGCPGTEGLGAFPDTRSKRKDAGEGSDSFLLQVTDDGGRGSSCSEMTCDSIAENRWQRWAGPSTQALALAKLKAAGSPPPSLAFGSFSKAPATGQWVQEVPVRDQALHDLASGSGGKNKPTKPKSMK